jgi:phosphoribosylformylglycinamidine synthase
MNKFGVVVFPGSNCDEDMVGVLESISGGSVEHLWHKEANLKNCDFIVLPGGFSYGDYLRSGAIARFSPIMSEVIKHANNGGYVLGVCNGFQVLCEAGLLPGALLHNSNQKFICSNVYLLPGTDRSLLTSELNLNTSLKIPIAHGEGRYYADESQIKTIQDNDQVLFRYCNAEGQVTLDSNPNGSIDNIAGICNEKRTVFGMMPHPERAADEVLGNTDGVKIF